MLNTINFKQLKMIRFPTGKEKRAKALNLCGDELVVGALNINRWNS